MKSALTIIANIPAEGMTSQHQCNNKKCRYNLLWYINIRLVNKYYKNIRGSICDQSKHETKKSVAIGFEPPKPKRQREYTTCSVGPIPVAIATFESRQHQQMAPYRAPRWMTVKLSTQSAQICMGKWARKKFSIFLSMMRKCQTAGPSYSSATTTVLG